MPVDLKDRLPYIPSTEAIGSSEDARLYDFRLRIDQVWYDVEPEGFLGEGGVPLGRFNIATEEVVAGIIRPEELALEGLGQEEVRHRRPSARRQRKIAADRARRQRIVDIVLAEIVGGQVIDIEDRAEYEVIPDHVSVFPRKMGQKADLEFFDFEELSGPSDVQRA